MSVCLRFNILRVAAHQIIPSFSPEMSLLQDCVQEEESECSFKAHWCCCPHLLYTVYKRNHYTHCQLWCFLIYRVYFSIGTYTGLLIIHQDTLRLFCTLINVLSGAQSYTTQCISEIKQNQNPEFEANRSKKIITIILKIHKNIFF